METLSSSTYAGPSVKYRPYRSEEYDLKDIMDLVDQELSEPYNIYTFRYFLQEWPHLTWLVYPDITTNANHERERAIATIVCKQDFHKGRVNRGYIAMLSVDRGWRRKGIARKLIELAMRDMITYGADEIVLETEYDNLASLTLYGSMGFIKDRRLYRFYLNGKDAFRLVYPVSKTQSPASSHSADLPESPRLPRRLPPPSSPLPYESPISVLDGATNLSLGNSEVDETSPSTIARNGQCRSERGNLYAFREDNEVVAAAENEERVDEIQEKVERGMML